MGWYGGYETKREMVDYLNRDEQDDSRLYRVLKKRVVREGGVSILWQVCEVVALQDGEKMRRGETRRFIRCNLLDKSSFGSWAYKPMSEADGPCYYSCPAGFLIGVPCPNDWAREWRAKVRAYQG